MASFAALVAFAGADAVRLQLLKELPSWTHPVGWVLFIGGWWFVYRALRANAFAVTVVRVQDERGHRVVRTGPYAVVRHPMYAAFVLVMVGMGLWLHSTAAAIGALVPVAFLVTRVVHEERVLRARLPEYVDYAATVRWRMLPGVW